MLDSAILKVTAKTSAVVFVKTGTFGRLMKSEKFI